MKLINTTFTLLLVILISSNIQAQKKKIKYRPNDDLITVDKEPYAIMKKTSADFFNYNFSIQNLQGEELIQFNYGFNTRRVWSPSAGRYTDTKDGYYDVTFENGAETARINKSLGETAVMKEVVNNGLIVNNRIDQEAKIAFIQLYGGNTPLMVDGNDIFKNGNIIGKFVETVEQDDSIEWNVVNVYSHSGEKIAIISTPVSDPIEIEIFTSKDEKVHTLLYESVQTKEALFNWLYKQKYL